eukprot:GHRR01001461.1.p1 GENE.GHRR01001461.1~~GHRR01001461.1.p1  ORF type:complete len:264 (+),score=69.25 GHRR01001461.1:258-1049(+)
MAIACGSMVCHAVHAHGSRSVVQVAARLMPAPRSSRPVHPAKRCHIRASAWGSSEPGSASLQPFTSFREMEQQVGQDTQDFMLPFSSIRRFEDSMNQQMREMDRQFDRAFADMDRLQLEFDQEMEHSMRRLQEQPPGVRIERREERSAGSYRYFESIQIRQGTTVATTVTPMYSQPLAMFNPMLFAAVMLAGAYAAITAAFSKNYDFTTYKRDGSRWQLLLLWPVLVPFSNAFRQQFVSALKGEKFKVLDSAAGSESNSTASS